MVAMGLTPKEIQEVVDLQEKIDKIVWPLREKELEGFRRTKPRFPSLGRGFFERYKTYKKIKASWWKRFRDWTYSDHPLQSALKKLQKKCTHPKTRIVGNGSYEYPGVYKCRLCGQTLGEVSPGLY